jgi:toxin ParE1/3/4
MSRYIISDEAIEDLDRISEYFLQNNLETGEQFVQAFNAKCLQLIRFPKMGRRYSQIRSNVRGVVLRGFIIFYQTSGELETVDIEILRVVSGRRDLNSIFPPDVET